MNIKYMHPADQLVMFMRRIYDKGLTTTSGGNLSIMDSDGNIWFSNRTNLVRYDKSQGTLASVHDDWFIDGRSYSLVASASNDEGVVFFGGNAGITRVDTGIPFPEPHERHLGLVLCNT